MAETNRTGTSAWVVPEARHWDEADARGMVAALRASGEGIAEFARRHGLHEERVRRWHRRLEGRRAATPPATAMTFAPVRVLAAPTSPAPAADASLEVTVGGAVVRVRPDFDAALLARLVAALGGARC